MQGWHAPGTCRWSQAHFDAALIPSPAPSAPQEQQRGCRKRRQQDVAFLARQGEQTWGSPGGRGHFPTTCCRTALPRAPSPAMKGGASALVTPNAHKNTGQTLGNLMGGLHLGHCAKHQGPWCELSHGAGPFLWEGKVPAAAGPSAQGEAQGKGLRHGRAAQHCRTESPWASLCRAEEGFERSAPPVLCIRDAPLDRTAIPPPQPGVRSPRSGCGGP